MEDCFYVKMSSTEALQIPQRDIRMTRQRDSNCYEVFQKDK